MLNQHYNKNNSIPTPPKLIAVIEKTLRKFFESIKQGKDADPSWKKAIYKEIQPLVGLSRTYKLQIKSVICPYNCSRLLVLGHGKRGSRVPETVTPGFLFGIRNFYSTQVSNFQRIFYHSFLLLLKMRQYNVHFGIYCNLLGFSVQLFAHCYGFSKKSP